MSLWTGPTPLPLRMWGRITDFLPFHPHCIAGFPRKLPPQNRPAVRSAGNLLTRFVQSITSPLCLFLCNTCHGRKEVQSFSVDYPWICRSEIQSHRVPTVTVSFRSPGRHLVYDLCSAIYLGARNSPGEWWNHDMMWRLGTAQRDHIQIVEDFPPLMGPAMLLS